MYLRRSSPNDEANFCGTGFPGRSHGSQQLPGFCLRLVLVGRRRALLANDLLLCAKGESLLPPKSQALPAGVLRPGLLSAGRPDVSARLLPALRRPGLLPPRRPGVSAGLLPALRRPGLLSPGRPRLSARFIPALRWPGLLPTGRSGLYARLLPACGYSQLLPAGSSGRSTGPWLPPGSPRSPSCTPSVGNSVARRYLGPQPCGPSAPETPSSSRAARAACALHSRSAARLRRQRISRLLHPLFRPPMRSLQRRPAEALGEGRATTGPVGLGMVPQNHDRTHVHTRTVVMTPVSVVVLPAASPAALATSMVTAVIASSLSAAASRVW
jgi:hypothetical protein